MSFDCPGKGIQVIPGKSIIVISVTLGEFMYKTIGFLEMSLLVPHSLSVNSYIC